MTEIIGNETSTFFQALLGSIITLVICVLIGYIGRVARVLSDETDRAVSIIIVNFALPATVLGSMLRPFSINLLFEGLVVFLVMVFVFLFGYVLGSLLAKIMKASHSEKRVWQFSLMFPNVVYIGFPVTLAVFGDEGVIHATMVTVAFNLLVFTIGVFLIESSICASANMSSGLSSFKSSLKNSLLSPTLFALYIGLIFFITGYRLPVVVETGITLFGGMTTPLAMLLIGSLLAKYIAKNGLLKLINDWRVYPVVFIRLLLIPFITFAIVAQFIANPVMLGVIVTLAAMPVATLTVIFTEQYGGDTPSALKVVALSDLLCIITLPLIILTIVS